MCHLQASKRKYMSAENGWLAKRKAFPGATIHILWYWHVWSYLGCLFTYLSSRAIHIESAISLSIDDDQWWIVFVVWLTDERRSLFSSRDHCQRPSPSRISDTPRAGFEPAQNLSSGFDEWSCAVVITTTPRRQDAFIQALWRFVSRRGNVRVIRTDKGRNYVGASAELNKAFSEMNLYQMFIVQFRYVQCNYWQWNQGLLCHPQESFRKKTYIVGNSGDVCNT